MQITRKLRTLLPEAKEMLAIGSMSPVGPTATAKRHPTPAKTISRSTTPVPTSKTPKFLISIAQSLLTSLRKLETLITLKLWKLIAMKVSPSKPKSLVKRGPREI